MPDECRFLAVALFTEEYTAVMTSIQREHVLTIVIEPTLRTGIVRVTWERWGGQPILD